MASEPSDQRSVSVPSELDEWLTKHASDIGVGRDELLVQLLATYRTAIERDGERDGPPLLTVEPDADVVADLVHAAVQDELDDVAAAVADRLEDGDDVAAELDRIQADFREKLDDVRERVIQVKKETDQKASAEHDHAEFDAMADQLDDLESSMEVLRAGFEDRLDDLEAADEGDDTPEPDDLVDEFGDRLDDVEEKLRTVAWVVSDLRDAHETESGTDDTVAHLKQSAARANVDRAQCENCGNAVQVSLLTDPECPHCDATVTEVVPSTGFFGRPRLSVAKQLEAGDERERDVPDAARGE
ncbi:hypothetical protein VB773_13645 [Haloarculaceae archaeon H-GB2-1]|nr:hypothetical protein [Haloarculaceae archaeon H-GB1-1]MEA5387006.1 hypothetical protein [Haloarculaceae archaeon H-GB11]MEA5408508.1 hypothetical protein [Haloarculaceae archaeon H-GB2-1]